MNSALRSLVGLSAVACLFLAGCVSDVSDAEDENVGEAEGAWKNQNSLDLGSVQFGEIHLHPLSPATLPPDAQLAIQDPGALGAEARATMRYIVNCVQPELSSFKFSWV